MKHFLAVLTFLCLGELTYSQGFLQAEYFFDTDPGIGNGITHSIGSSDDNTQFSISVPVSSLSPGFHHLIIRLQHNDGTWGLFETRRFYISETVTSGGLNSADIVSAEYYIDTDPGAGNGSTLSVGTSGGIVNFSAMIPSSLPTGFHLLSIRTKDADGKWGLFESRRFYVLPLPDVDMTAITVAEYFFDTDPGPGNGYPLAVPLSGEVVNLSSDMTVPCLSTGQHFMTVRVRDQQNHWGLFAYDTLNVTGISASVVTPAGPIAICTNESILLSSEDVPGIQYQWLLNGSDIPSATSASYTVTTTSGNYSLKATCHGIFAISNVVSVTILPLNSFYEDSDEDGYGNAVEEIIHCIQPTGYVLDNTDCDDDNAAIHEPVEYFIDADEDGFGSSNTEFVCSLSPSLGYSLNSDDCDDTNPLVNPSAVEGCNGIDDDCDQMTDDEDTDISGQLTWYADTDGDGYGDATSSLFACFQPFGYVLDNSDCDDTNGAVYPSANEACNGLDDDCDGNIPADEADGDGDGYRLCQNDCNDEDSTIHPGVEELCSNTIDDDCDGLVNEGCGAALMVDAGTCQVVFYGYAPQACTTLTALASGGISPYSYSWSNGGTSVSISVCPNATTVYSVTVTDHVGATAVNGVMVEVVDVHCGNNNDKVLVCHFPTGNQGNPNTLCVGESAVSDHLAHGDYLGDCGSTSPCSGGQYLVMPGNNDIPIAIGIAERVKQQEIDASGIAIFPNPAGKEVTFHLHGFGDEPAEITLLDYSGKVVWQKRMEGGQHELKVDLSDDNFTSGIYIAKINSQSDVLTKCFVILTENMQ